MIDLTPLDVRNKRGDFKKIMRGYDPPEVDVFLELVAERLEALVRENMKLRERTTSLQDQVAQQADREQAVQNALVTAQELRADIKAQSQREADHVLKEADIEAKRLVSDAEAEVRRLLMEADAEVRSRLRGIERRVDQAHGALEGLERSRSRFLTEYRSLLERELEVVRSEEGRVATPPDTLEVASADRVGPLAAAGAAPPAEESVPSEAPVDEAAPAPDPSMPESAEAEPAVVEPTAFEPPTSEPTAAEPSAAEPSAAEPVADAEDVDVDATATEFEPAEWPRADAPVSDAAEWDDPAATTVAEDVRVEDLAPEASSEDLAPEASSEGVAEEPVEASTDAAPPTAPASSEPEPWEVPYLGQSAPEPIERSVDPDPVQETRAEVESLFDRLKRDQAAHDALSAQAAPSPESVEPSAPSEVFDLPDHFGRKSDLDPSEVVREATERFQPVDVNDLGPEPPSLEYELRAAASEAEAPSEVHREDVSDRFPDVPDLETVLAEAGIEEVVPPPMDRAPPPPPNVPGTRPDNLIRFDPDHKRPNEPGR